MNPDRLTDLYDQFDSITDDERFSRLADRHGLDVTSLNRLRRVLEEQLRERGLEDAVYGRNPYRDPNLPSSEARRADDEPAARGEDGPRAHERGTWGEDAGE